MAPVWRVGEGVRYRANAKMHGLFCGATCSYTPGPGNREVGTVFDTKHLETFGFIALGEI